MPVDLYVGGVEHAVLHLLYSRFWHKVLFDLGHVSTPEPFMRLVNQGLILGEMEYHVVRDRRRHAGHARRTAKTSTRKRREHGVTHGRASTQDRREADRPAADARRRSRRRRTATACKSNPTIRVDARSFKMSKSRGNVVNPDDIVAGLRRRRVPPVRDVHGPAGGAEAVEHARHRRHDAVPQRASGGTWSATRSRTRSRRSQTTPIPEALDRQMHRTIKKVGEDIAGLRFNTGHRGADQAEQRDDQAAVGPARAGRELHADARPVRAAPGRGAVAAARPHQEPGPPPVADVRPGEAGRDRRWSCRCR